MAKKKTQDPEQDHVEPLEETPEPEAYENEDYPELMETQSMGTPVWYVEYIDPAEDVLRQIAAGQTPEGQRLTRDQMMGMAAKIVADGA